MLNKILLSLVFILVSCRQCSANDSLLVDTKWTLMYTRVYHGDTIQHHGKSHIHLYTEIGTGNYGGPTIFFKSNHMFIKIKPIGERENGCWSTDKDTLIIQREYGTKKKEICKYIMRFETQKELVLYLSPVTHQRTKYVFGREDNITIEKPIQDSVQEHNRMKETPTNTTGISNGHQIGLCPLTVGLFMQTFHV